MAVDETTSDDKPARAEPADGPASPCPDREDPGAVPRQARAGGKEHHVISESSEDEIDETVEEQQGNPGASDPEKAPSSRPQSRRGSSSANTNTVPRAQRRGLLGRLTLIPEVERPYEYKNSTKWTITAIVALAAAGAPMGSGIFLRGFCPPTDLNFVTDCAPQLPSPACRLIWASPRLSPT
jgi:hypothetical protein